MFTAVLNLKFYLLIQWTAGVSSNRLRQTVQNFLLWCVGSDQQCATGFLMMQGAVPEQGVTTLVTHLSWTIKLHTAIENKWRKDEIKKRFEWKRKKFMSKCNSKCAGLAHQRFLKIDRQIQVSHYECCFFLSLSLKIGPCFWMKHDSLL